MAQRRRAGGRSSSLRNASRAAGRSTADWRVSPWPARLKLAGVLGALVLVNLYVFVWRKDTSLASLLQSASVGQRVEPLRPGQSPVAGGGAASPEAAAIARESAELAKAQPAIPDTGHVSPEESRAAEAAPPARTVEGVIRKRDSLAAALNRAGLQPNQREELLRALRPVLEMRRVREGQRFTLLTTEAGDVVEFTYVASPIERYRVTRGADGLLVGKRERKPLRREIVKLGSVIDTSLYDAIARSGEKTTLVSFFVDVFAWDINFFTDTRPGDHFKMIVEKLYNGDTFYRYGRVLAAEYGARRKGKVYRAFWFQPPCPGGGEDAGEQRSTRCPPGGYYDEQGRSIQKTLLKTPLKYVRITSRFSTARFHPILHKVRSHLGVDYAAPKGTPVWATASGRVVQRGWAGGAGNMVVLSHPGGMVSLYMHLSRFAKGLKVGQKVRQKQVIGYVGSTGLSTGPHLHFALKLKGRYINPLSYKATGKSIVSVPAAYRDAFRSELGPRLATLAGISVAAGEEAAPSPPVAAGN